MAAQAKLQSIIRTLDQIKRSTGDHDHAGGAPSLRRKLPKLVKADAREEFFEDIIAFLEKVPPNTGTLNLRRRADESNYFLNLVFGGVILPPKQVDASMRFVVEDEHLRSSPLVYEALLGHAAYGVNQEIRRFAWYNVSKLVAQNSPALAASTASIPRKKWGREDLKRLRHQFLKDRKMLGPRGTILESASIRSEGAGLVPELLTALGIPGARERREVALTLGELGGDFEAKLLADALCLQLDGASTDEDYQTYLASALSRIGGPDAVEGLLLAAERGSERVRLAALSGLEGLATAGAVALTEASEPVSITSEEMRDAYLNLAERLRQISNDRETPPYVCHKSKELLDTILISLKSASALAV